MAEFTKGKWKISFPYIYQKNNHGSYRFHITINIEGHQDSGNYTSREELEANARLIAAAPDLYAACKELTVALDNCPGEFNYDPKIEDRAKAALAKADKKGE